MIAMLLGSYLYGYVSDMFGRRLACLLSLLNVAVGLLLTAFMPDYVSFTIIRFVSGLGIITKIVVIFINKSFGTKNVAYNHTVPNTIFKSTFRV